MFFIRKKYEIKWSEKHWQYIIYNRMNNTIHSFYSYYSDNSWKNHHEFDIGLKEKCREINIEDMDDQRYLREIYKRCLPFHKQIAYMFFGGIYKI